MAIDRLMYWFSKPVVSTYSDTMLKLDVRRINCCQKAQNHRRQPPFTTDPFYVARMVRRNLHN